MSLKRRLQSKPFQNPVGYHEPDKGQKEGWMENIVSNTDNSIVSLKNPDLDCSLYSDFCILYHIHKLLFFPPGSLTPHITHITGPD